MGHQTVNDRPDFTGYWRILKHDNLDVFLKVSATKFGTFLRVFQMQIRFGQRLYLVPSILVYRDRGPSCTQEDQTL
jgi:hypothetical protein